MSTTYTLYAQRPSCLKAHAAGISSGWTLEKLEPGFAFNRPFFFFISTPQVPTPMTLGSFGNEEELYARIERELRYLAALFPHDKACEVVNV